MRLVYFLLLACFCLFVASQVEENGIDINKPQAPDAIVEDFKYFVDDGWELADIQTPPVVAVQLHLAGGPPKPPPAPLDAVQHLLNVLDLGPIATHEYQLSEVVSDPMALAIPDDNEDFFPVTPVLSSVQEAAEDTFAVGGLHAVQAVQTVQTIQAVQTVQTVPDVIPPVGSRDGHVRYSGELINAYEEGEFDDDNDAEAAENVAAPPDNNNQANHAVNNDDVVDNPAVAVVQHIASRSHISKYRYDSMDHSILPNELHLCHYDDSGDEVDPDKAYCFFYGDGFDQDYLKNNYNNNNDDDDDSDPPAAGSVIERVPRQHDTVVEVSKPPHYSSPLNDYVVLAGGGILVASLVLLFAVCSWSTRTDVRIADNESTEGNTPMVMSMAASEVVDSADVTPIIDTTATSGNVSSLVSNEVVVLDNPTSPIDEAIMSASVVPPIVDEPTAAVEYFPSVPLDQDLNVGRRPVDNSDLHEILLNPFEFSLTTDGREDLLEVTPLTIVNPLDFPFVIGSSDPFGEELSPFTVDRTLPSDDHERDVPILIESYTQSFNSPFRNRVLSRTLRSIESGRLNGRSSPLSILTAGSLEPSLVGDMFVEDYIEVTPGVRTRHSSVASSVASSVVSGMRSVTYTYGRDDDRSGIIHADLSDLESYTSTH